MKVVCVGGGPAGLYLAISMKLRDPAHDVLVVERNRADDTFGWGVVFSNETLANLWQNDAAERRGDRGELPALGRHRRALQGARRPLGRPWLRRHRPQAPAEHPPGARPRPRRPAAARARGRRSFGFSRGRSDRRGRRHQQRHPRALRRGLPARASSGAGTSTSGSAPIGPSRPSPSPSRRPRRGGSGRTPIASTPPPRPSSSSATRRPGGGSASIA